MPCLFCHFSVTSVMYKKKKKKSSKTVTPRAATATSPSGASAATRLTRGRANPRLSRQEIMEALNEESSDSDEEEPHQEGKRSPKDSTTIPTSEF